MKIKSQMFISILFFGLLLCIVSTLIFITEHVAEKLNGQMDIANKINLEANELSYLSNEYLLYRENQQIIRWKSKFLSISKDIADLNVDKPDQNAIVSNLRLNQIRTEKVMNDVISEADRLAASGPKNPAMEFIQISWSRISVQTRSIVFDASRLSKKLND